MRREKRAAVRREWEERSSEKRREGYVKRIARDLKKSNMKTDSIPDNPFLEWLDIISLLLILRTWHRPIEFSPFSHSSSPWLTYVHCHLLVVPTNPVRKRPCLQVLEEYCWFQLPTGSCLRAWFDPLGWCCRRRCCYLHRRLAIIPKGFLPKDSCGWKQLGVQPWPWRCSYLDNNNIKYNM